MSTKLNPFARTQLKFEEQLQLMSVVTKLHGERTLLYRVSRTAANAGLLDNQFKAGKPLVVNGEHLVIASSSLELSEHGALLTVRGVTFETILAGARARSEDPKPVDLGKEIRAAAEAAKPNFGPRARKIIA